MPVTMGTMAEIVKTVETLRGGLVQGQKQIDLTLKTKMPQHQKAIPAMVKVIRELNLPREHLREIPGPKKAALIAS